ncbi:MAG: hypothetical protein Q9163_003119 [Psora crenata]
MASAEYFTILKISIFHHSLIREQSQTVKAAISKSVMPLARLRPLRIERISLSAQGTTGDHSVPVCDRCHHILHHLNGVSVAHPTIRSLRNIISESPHKYNHIYHVIDAADFPLSLIPSIQRLLSLTPQRSHNRRARTTYFHHGRVMDISFIITRSDLLAPRKEQVDSLMPCILQILRDTLGHSAAKVRLGNVHCVSAKRGWWTSQVKEEIYERGGAGWMVGKVNVGKSNLFESVFPKGRTSDVNTSTLRHTVEPGIQQKQSLSDPIEVTAQLDRQQCSGAWFDDGQTLQESHLPPAPLERPFPVLPLVSSLPGTTASPIRLPFGNGKGELIDLPGLGRGELEAYVKEEHKQDLVMRSRPKPKQISIKYGQSLLLGGLVRITPLTPDLNVLAYPFVPLESHVASTEGVIAIHTQREASTTLSIAKPGIGNRMASAGRFPLKYDVTKQRAGPLTSKAAVGLTTNALPFLVFSTDVLIEGCGWVELVAQVRRKDFVGHADAGAFLDDKPYPQFELLDIRIGPGAARLPKEVKGIQLDFAHKYNDGHFGARKVWRSYLPRLKYHNPAVSMTVNRHTNQAGPSTLTIYYSHVPAAPSSAPQPSIGLSTKASGHEGEGRIETIDMKHKHESEILHMLTKLTGAVPYEPSQEEVADLEEVKENVRRSRRDSERQAGLNETKRREAALLEQARGST